jgi:ribosomal protein L11 methyltransferase
VNNLYHTDDRAVGILLTAFVFLTLETDDSVAAKIADIYDEDALSSSWEKKEVGPHAGHHFLWVFDKPITPAKLARDIEKAVGIQLDTAAIKIEKVVEDTNWLELSYQQFPPFSVGSFYLYGSHHQDPPPRGHLPLLIDAATAFGSGEHGTTKGCLESLERLKQNGFSPLHILDMGTGSGILAIAAYRLWPQSKILAVDNDAEATKVACRHRRKNNVPSQHLICATGDGYHARRVRDLTPYDLIIANILAGPLISMAPDIAAHTKKGGRIILSGLLASQYEDVKKAHENTGFSVDYLLQHDEWMAVTMIKNQ